MEYSIVSQWWTEWQLEVLVLVSLATQCFLVIFGGLRRHRTPPYFKLLLWLSFLGGDAMALYALAAPMLQWKMQQYISPQRSHDLEVLWAPLLLMHLGGQRCITAFKLEDNELWYNQAYISVAKVVLAVCAFWNTWSTLADHRLFVAAILLFISGMVKCIDRPLTLKSSSFQSLSNVVNEAEGTTRTGSVLRLEQYVQRVRNFFDSGEAENTAPIFPPVMPALLPQKLFVDFPHNYFDRFRTLRSFLPLKQEQMYNVLTSGLTAIFELMFTKTPPPLIGNSRAPILYFYATLASATILPIVAILLVSASSKQAYRSVDVAVTYVLMFGTVAVEIISVWLMLRSRTMWPDMVAQQNIFQYCVHNKRHSKLMKFAGWFQCKEMIDKYLWSMDPCYDSGHITEIILTHIKQVWKRYIKDAESYCGYTNVRGAWILEGMGCLRSMDWSIKMPFDESVIVWHIATELCCIPSRGSLTFGQKRCKQMSNYLMHLLFAESEMLAPGSRNGMFTAACNQLTDILVGEEVAWDDADGLVLTVYEKLLAGRAPEEASFFRDALLLAKSLMDLGGQGDGSDMWLVIQGVWVEMMCFSASRCRGYLHAKSLGSSGGEYLSFVSLLLAYTGMPTVPDTLQTSRAFPEAAEVPISRAVVFASTARVLAHAAELIQDEAAMLPNKSEVYINAAAMLLNAAKLIPLKAEMIEAAAEVLAEADGEPAESDGEPEESDGEPAESDGEPVESDGESAESDGESAESDGETVEAEVVFPNMAEVYRNTAVVLLHAAGLIPDKATLLAEVANVLEEAAGALTGPAVLVPEGVQLNEIVVER